MDVSNLLECKRRCSIEYVARVLSSFEESSAASISDMLRQVSGGKYLEAIRMADRFILHIEVLFATIDDLEYQFAHLNLEGARLSSAPASWRRAQAVY